ncbi:hypothetical protein MUP32_00810 [Candidatus Microgenomates bacterium]|nr:hypothetical protein [Candidatus Microgenomates bacterium]
MDNISKTDKEVNSHLYNRSGFGKTLSSRVPIKSGRGDPDGIASPPTGGSQ